MLRLFFLLLPWLELFTLIQLGVQTSTLTALAYVAATGVLGMWILRRQGADIFRRLREAQGQVVMNSVMLRDNMAAGMAGILLMIPGMITDTLALLMLIGPLRRKLAEKLGFRESPEHAGPTTLDGDFRRVDDDDPRLP